MRQRPPLRSKTARAPELGGHGACAVFNQSGGRCLILDAGGTVLGADWGGSLHGFSLGAAKVGANSSAKEHRPLMIWSGVSQPTRSRGQSSDIRACVFLRSGRALSPPPVPAGAPAPPEPEETEEKEEETRSGCAPLQTASVEGRRGCAVRLSVRGPNSGDGVDDEEIDESPVDPGHELQHGGQVAGGLRPASSPPPPPLTFEFQRISILDPCGTIPWPFGRKCSMSFSTMCSRTMYLPQG